MEIKRNKLRLRCGFFVFAFCVMSMATIENLPSGYMKMYVTSPNLGIVINSNGNVGIGTTAPSTKLEVAGTVSASALVVNGSTATAIKTKTADYTLTASDSIILVDATSGVVTITLPLASSAMGRQYTVKKIDSGSNSVSIALSGSDTLDLQTTSFVMTAVCQYLIVASDGTNWYIVGGN